MNTPLKSKIRDLYDYGSQPYLQTLGQHIHDGFYQSGRETREEAQVKLVSYLADWADIRPGDRILDVGCGLGGTAIWLAKNRSAVVTGITISQSQVNIASKLAAAEGLKIPFLLMDAENIKFDGQPFDVIWVLDAFVHFENKKAFLNSARRVLSDNGKIIIFDWALDEDAKPTEMVIRSFCHGMVLPQLRKISEWNKLLRESYYNPRNYLDITAVTGKTWNVNPLNLFRPKTLQHLAHMKWREWCKALSLLQGVISLKYGIKLGKIRAVAIISQKDM